VTLQFGYRAVTTHNTIVLPEQAWQPQQVPTPSTKLNSTIDRQKLLPPHLFLLDGLSEGIQFGSIPAGCTARRVEFTGWRAESSPPATPRINFYFRIFHDILFISFSPPA